MRYSDFTPEHEAKFIEFTKNGTAAALLYSPNVLSNGKVTKYSDADRSVRAFAVSGTIYVPTVFFTEHLGAVLNGDILTYNGRTAPAKDKAVSSKFSAVSVLETAGKLGFTARAYCDGRFIAVGTQNNIEILDDDPSLVHAGSYAILGEYNAENFTAADFKAAKDNWRRKLTGTPEGNLSNGYVAAEKNSEYRKAVRRKLQEYAPRHQSSRR